MRKITAFVLCIVIAATGLGLMAFAPSPLVNNPSANALPTRSATRTPKTGGQADQELTLNLQREQNFLQRQTLHLNQANQLISKAQDLISKAQAKGVDVTSLNNALDAFKTQVASAQASHDQAASLLNAKNGFDTNNGVTDRQAAHQTLLDARNALREAHLTLQKCMLDLRTALQQWRMQNSVK